MNKCIASDVQEMLPDLLHDAFDDRAKARVEAHLATCASCREDLDVLRMVKSAAIFAPSIDVDRVVRQIPPYRTIVPASQPARTRGVTWLLAASLVLAAIGGGSALIGKYRGGNTPSVATTIARQPITSPTPAPRESIAASANNATRVPVGTRGLALAADVEGLSDGNLVQLMNDMNDFDALPVSEPEPVLSVDSGDGY